MPLTINVGLSRKSSENYQSRGVSINVTAELDQALLAKPDRLQSQISGLYRQAEVALRDQVIKGNGQQDEPSTNGQRSQQESTRPNGDHRPATNSQLRALNAIADRLDIDLHDECRHEFGCRPKELGIRQASQLIDQLKAQQADNGSRGRSTTTSRSSRR